MGFFSWLFGSKKEVAPDVVTNKRNDEGISYDPALVPKLKEDHQQLLSMFGVINRTLESGSFERLPAQLRQFKMALQAHLVTENVRFYIYVQQQHANDSEVSGQVAELRREMDGIARAAVGFINRYEKAIFSPDVEASFRKELAGIGEVLVQRIKTEESSLYTLYTPK